APTAIVSAPPKRLARVLCLDDFQKAARKHLPRPIYSYVADAAETSSAYRANRSAFSSYELVPRVMVDITQRDRGVDLLGRRWDAPLTGAIWSWLERRGRRTCPSCSAALR